MAVVYLAYDPNFRRNIAIKLVSVNLHENPVFRERFEREAHLIARIEHPAIVPVYDFGEQDNQPYLVMRYMPGGALSDKLREGTLSLAYAAGIISQIAPALDAVHAQGIVHRDLKPANILLDGFGNPAISDFGIAHLTASTIDLTGSAIIGTPSYMSPEQVRGEDDLDGRSDIYALGVILFEMLTGRGPYHATTPLSIALKHLTEPLPSIRSFRPDLPTELEVVLNKALAKDRKLRYANASEIALDLRTILATFNEESTPAPGPVLLSKSEGVSTEIDTGEESSGSLSLGAFASTSEPGIDPSQGFPKTSAVPPESMDQSRLPSRKKLQIMTLTGLGLFLLIVCGIIGLVGAWAGLPRLFPGQNPTAIPTLTATQASNVQDIVLFSDDFSNPLSGWPTIKNAQGKYSYETDGYHIAVNETNAVLWAKTSKAYDNISVYVDARPITDDMNGYYGLLCRIQNDQNFYYFVIRSNGDYNIGKYKKAIFYPLFSENWAHSDAIHQGTQTNRLKVECVENTLRLYANNVLLGEVSDTDFTSGFSGMVAAALDIQNFEVTFSNFLITKADR